MLGTGVDGRRAWLGGGLIAGGRGCSRGARLHSGRPAAGKSETVSPGSLQAS
jgi:hypothetical protein